MINQEKLVILGSGPAGLTAAIYAARANLKPLVLEGSNPGGQLMNTTYVENWPGEKSILGPTLMHNLRQHAQLFGTQFLSEYAKKVELTTRPFLITTHKDTIISAQALIIATGATPKRLYCQGEENYWSKGVTTCAVCDGAFYKDRPVVIVGGGDSAMENALFMTNFTKDITIVHILPELTASYTMKNKVLNNPHIKVIYNSTVTNITGNNNHVTHITVTNQKTNDTQILKTDAVFIAIGLKPNTELFKNQLKLDKYGYIDTINQIETSIPGVFAAGDVADYIYRQAITSAGTGCMASLAAERYLHAQEI